MVSVPGERVLRRAAGAGVGVVLQPVPEAVIDLGAAQPVFETARVSAG